MRAYADAEDRLSLWRRFLIDTRPTAVAEIGVYRGIFAETALQATDSIDVYYMIDPWRHLRDWDKPFNVDDDEFARVHDEAMARTAFADERRVVLRGTSAEKVDQIPDASLDLAYVDGDHSLRGITNDLLRIWPKMRPGGVVGCDDFVPTIWQHPGAFEPTFVFPYGVYFAEAVGATAWALPHRQLAIEVPSGPGDGAGFHDLVGRYGDTSVRGALRGRMRTTIRSLARGAGKRVGLVRPRR